MKGDLKAVLSGIHKGKSPSVLLLHGDDLQVKAAVKSILDLLVPVEKRVFNLEMFDGRTTDWEQIDSALRIPPLYPGTKAVFVENAPYFLSREHKGELGEKVLQLWGEGKKDEAARLFLDLLLLEGWTQERLEGLQPSPPPAQVIELFGGDEKDIREDVEGLILFCRTRGIDLSQPRRSEGHRLLELVEQGLPPWEVLLITASHVDRRTRLYRRFEERGLVLDLSLAREKSGGISREILAEFLDQRLTEVGKRIEAQGRELILRRAGGELWTVHQELEKLFLYVGEEAWIRVKDVEEVFLDLGESWVFDLTRSIAERDSLRALGYLARLLSQGEHPLKLLGTIASEVRRLLAARSLMEGEMRERWKSGMTFPQFQRSMTREGASLVSGNLYREYMRFKTAENFSTQELLRAMECIHRADSRLKSTGNSPRVVMEGLVLEMCRGEG